jgi:hypothetical protein
MRSTEDPGGLGKRFRKSVALCGPRRAAIAALLLCKGASAATRVAGLLGYWEHFGEIFFVQQLLVVLVVFEVFEAGGN